MNLKRELSGESVDRLPLAFWEETNSFARDYIKVSQFARYPSGLAIHIQKLWVWSSKNWSSDEHFFGCLIVWNAKLQPFWWSAFRKMSPLQLPIPLSVESDCTTKSLLLRSLRLFLAARLPCIPSLLCCRKSLWIGQRSLLSIGFLESKKIPECIWIYHCQLR